MNEQIEIPISKMKLFLLLIGALGFVIIGIFFTIEPDNFISLRYNNATVISVVGSLSIVFFGVCFIFILKKLFDSKVGLIINQTGIIDNSSGTSVGLIEWNDVTGIQTYQIYSTKFIVILTDQPGKYIDKASNGLMKKAMQANNNMCGSPLTVNSNSLKISHQKLEELLVGKWNEHVKNQVLSRL